MTNTILHIDASARREGSATRDLSNRIVKHLGAARIIRRDLATPLPLLTEAWINANFTPADQRSDAQRDQLTLSDTLVTELQDADTIVIGLPIYNFSVPAAFKAWIDLVARVASAWFWPSHRAVRRSGPRLTLQRATSAMCWALSALPILRSSPPTKWPWTPNPR